jgi:hypothetical protein
MESFVKRFGEPLHGMSPLLFQPNMTPSHVPKVLISIFDTYTGTNEKLTVYIAQQIVKRVKNKQWTFQTSEESYAISKDVDVTTTIEWPLDIAFRNESEIWDCLDTAATHLVDDGALHDGYMRVINVRECTINIERATVVGVTARFRCSLLC